jgi:hypothetical protein
MLCCSKFSCFKLAGARGTRTRDLLRDRQKDILVGNEALLR